MNSNHFITKAILSVLMVFAYFALPKYGFASFDGIVSTDKIVTHLLYPFSHANIWHITANLVCLWMVSCRFHIFVAYAIAVLCSFIPSISLFDCITHWQIEPTQEPTMGFSGILFATVGISWGKVHNFRDMIWRNKWYLIIPAFLPHINFLIHTYCMLLGYLYGSLLCEHISNSLCVKKSAN